AGRGMFFLPEKNDEVLVAFEQGDRGRPYVLGALWNGRDKPPEANADGRNNLRLIKSRSGHVVRLDDSLGAEKIEIIDKSGSNSISIDTATNSITIKAMRDVIIEAPLGKISLSAQSVEVKSTADTKVESKTTMDLSANGITTIKGQLVNIN
ncbi:MAG TPA: phage baseplate assembly protein V, partial [Terrimicrobiaceae bacterium]|nr:phage baseplate assembly protein V [Terrimicrobiaceae bacterium]